MFRAVFDKEMANVDAGDFVVTGGTTATITSVVPAANTAVNGNPKAFDITVSGGDLGAFSGTVGIDLVESPTINSLDGNIPLAPPRDGLRRDTFTVVGTGTPGPETPGPETPGPETPGPETPGDTDGSLSSDSEFNVLAIDALGSTQALSLTVELSEILTVGSLTIFSTDANGGNRKPIATFSVVENENNVLPDFNPKFTLLNSELVDITHLQFELEEKGVKSIAIPEELDDGSIGLTFEDGTKFAAALEETPLAANVLINDAETIDLTDLTGTVNISGSIRREAKLDNVVDLYITDADGAVFDAMGNKFLPGQEGYREAAIASRLNINLTGTNGQVETFNATLAGGTHLGLFIAVDGVDPAIDPNGEVFFSHSGANGGTDHFRTLGNNTFGIEDQAGLGDSDFNDAIVAFDIV